MFRVTIWLRGGIHAETTLSPEVLAQFREDWTRGKKRDYTIFDIDSGKTTMQFLMSEVVAVTWREI